MELQQILEILTRMTAEEKQHWLRVAAGLFLLVVVLLWLERRFFKASGRAGSWLAVRLASAMAAPLALAALWLPARAVGGPEALAVFYLALFTVVPFIWFGTHVYAGRRVRPPLSGAESLVLSITGLLILAIPGTAYFAVQGPLYAAARDIGQRRELPADNPPLQHKVQAVQRYNLAGAGLIYTQSLLGVPDMRLLRIEQRQFGQWQTDLHIAHPVYCTNGNDVHLMWSAKEAPPYLRLHWAQSNGAAAHSEFTPQMEFDADKPAAEFTVGFRPDGVDPVAPIPRSRAYLVLTKPGLTPYTQMLGSPPGAGEMRTTDCVMHGFKRWASSEDWQVDAMGLLFYLPTGGDALRSLLERPH